MERYSKITNKNNREIVLLKAKPCAWGKCKFCDYIDDNSKNIPEMVQLNKRVLEKVTGEFGVLEVIDSASCFELPKETLADIKRVIQEKNIQKLFLEAHWMYRYRLQEMRDYFGIEIVFKIGVETFNNNFRQNVLNKNADFEEPEEVTKYFDSPCIMVGIKGQTKEMIQRDMEILEKYFNLGTVNVYNNNTTEIKEDPSLIKWFEKEYQWMVDDPRFEVLFRNTDFGVGE